MSKESEYWNGQAKRMSDLERSCRELKESWHKAVQEIKAIRERAFTPIEIRDVSESVESWMWDDD